MRGIRGKKIAMIFQEPMTSLNPVFTIGDQIGETVRLHEGLTARQARSTRSTAEARRNPGRRRSGLTSSRISSPAGCGSG